jgi:hypothetical protein
MNEGKCRWFRVGTRTPIIPMEDGQDFENRNMTVNACVKLMPALTQSAEINELKNICLTKKLRSREKSRVQQRATNVRLCVQVLSLIIIIIIIILFNYSLLVFRVNSQNGQ